MWRSLPSLASFVGRRRRGWWRRRREALDFASKPSSVARGGVRAFVFHHFLLFLKISRRPN